MIGLVIITYGSLATAFIEALERIVGPRDNIRPICIYPNDNIDDHRHNILKTIDEIDPVKGVILLTDMFGGTASNLAIASLGIKPVEVVAGVNLPMLVHLARLKEGTSVKEAALQAQEIGRKYIHTISTLLESKVVEPVTRDQLISKASDPKKTSKNMALKK